MRQEDAGAASGLVNVMQQLGEPLGLAIAIRGRGAATGGVPDWVREMGRADEVPDAAVR